MDEIAHRSIGRPRDRGWRIAFWRSGLAWRWLVDQAGDCRKIDAAVPGAGEGSREPSVQA
jgi:hypothetical protein